MFVFEYFIFISLEYRPRVTHLCVNKLDHQFGSWYKISSTNLWKDSMDISESIMYISIVQDKSKSISFKIFSYFEIIPSSPRLENIDIEGTLSLYTVPDTHKFPLDARIRIASHARIRIASHRKRGNARMCEHSHRMREMRAYARIRIACMRMRAYARIRIACAEMRAYARIRIACAEMRALRRERRVNEIAGMTPARVFWRQTPETGFVVVRCIHKYWG